MDQIDNIKLQTQDLYIQITYTPIHIHERTKRRINDFYLKRKDGKQERKKKILLEQSTTNPFYKGTNFINFIYLLD